MKILFCFALLLPPAFAQGKPNTQLSAAEFAGLTQLCGPAVPHDTLAAIARTESAFHPYALSINYPQTSARRAGYERSVMVLARQPRDLNEASNWAVWFQQHGYTVSVGLMQINTQTARTYGASLHDLFEPCKNVRIGATIITNIYHQTHTTNTTQASAFLNAISSYNSGNPRTGYFNGYVTSVISNRRAYE